MGIGQKIVGGGRGFHPPVFLGLKLMFTQRKLSEVHHNSCTLMLKISYSKILLYTHWSKFDALYGQCLFVNLVYIFFHFNLCCKLHFFHRDSDCITRHIFLHRWPKLSHTVTFMHKKCMTVKLCANKRDQNFRLRAPSRKWLEILTMHVGESHITTDKYWVNSPFKRLYIQRTLRVDFFLVKI